MVAFLVVVAWSAVRNGFEVKGVLMFRPLTCPLCSTQAQTTTPEGHLAEQVPKCQFGMRSNRSEIAGFSDRTSKATGALSNRGVSV